MTVGDLLERADSRELQEWQLLFQIKDEERDDLDGGEIIDPAMFEQEDEEDDG